MVTSSPPRRRGRPACHRNAPWLIPATAPVAMCLVIVRLFTRHLLDAYDRIDFPVRLGLVLSDLQPLPVSGLGAMNVATDTHRHPMRDHSDGLRINSRAASVLLRGRLRRPGSAWRCIGASHSGWHTRADGHAAWLPVACVGEGVAQPYASRSSGACPKIATRRWPRQHPLLQWTVIFRSRRRLPCGEGGWLRSSSTQRIHQTDRCPGLWQGVLP